MRAGGSYAERCMEACKEIQRMLLMPNHPVDPDLIVEQVSYGGAG